MKKFLYTTAAALLTVLGLAGCGQKQEPVAMKTVDLRYRVEDSYSLDATSPKSFTVVVTSTDPWTITSEHPDWCIIETEEGAASAADKVLKGQGDKTSVKVQYYDNTGLDDRVDHLTIASDYWVGKVVTIYQRGIAYLTVPADQLENQVTKAGGYITFDVSSNQKWTAEVVDGSNWVSISDGATGFGDGQVTIFAEENSSEIRYATVKVYDRLGVEAAEVHYTQDGVQLDIAVTEVRAGYDQLSTEFGVISNAKWTAVKDNESDTWYTIDNPDNEGDATLHITLTENTGTGLRQGGIVIRSVASDPDDFVAERIVMVKQAYRIEPVRIVMDATEIGAWESDKTNNPVWTPAMGGTLFPGYARLHNGSKDFGTYTFRWSNLSADALVRLWFCYSDAEEIKFNLDAASGSTKCSVNKGSGADPGLGNTTFDPAVAHEMTYKFDPSGTDFCHVTLLLDGVEFTSFDSSAGVMPAVLWGKSVNMYIGVETGSAVLEWYEYVAPVNWE